MTSTNQSPSKPQPHRVSTLPRPVPTSSGPGRTDHVIRDPDQHILKYHCTIKKKLTRSDRSNSKMIAAHISKDNVFVDSWMILPQSCGSLCRKPTARSCLFGAMRKVPNLGVRPPVRSSQTTEKQRNILHGMPVEELSSSGSSLEVFPFGTRRR